MRALFLSLAVLLSMPMMAVEIDGINYDFNAEAKEATVIAKSGDKYSGEVVIPEYVEHDGTAYSVTSIGNNAFSNCYALTSVTIPNSVTSIGVYAFRGCSGLTSVTISDIAAWCNIDFKDYDSNPLSYAHHLYLNGEEVKDLVIPNSVTSIGEAAFYGCSGLTSVTIPNSVTSIGDKAFNRCSGLTSLTIGNSVTWIGDEAFYKCSGLTSVTIGNSVTSIGDHAFAYCSGLTSVTIGNSVESIENYAFYYCSGLTSVTIPNSVTSIGDRAFFECSSLRKVLNFSNLNITKESSYGFVGYYAYVVLNNPEIIDNYVFAPNGNTYALYGYMGTDSNLQLPEKYKGENYVIGVYAFAACSCLTSVTIPNSVEGIGDHAFYNCYRLTSVTIGNSVESIGRGAFYECSGLTSVTIPNSVTSIGDEAFWGCRLQTIVYKAIKPESGSGITSTNMYNHTQLYVPEGAYWDYAFSDWGKFIRIKEMAMDAEDLESRKVYMIADATGRNYSVYDSEKGDLVNVVYTHSLDEESEGSCWVVLKEGDTSYLYNIGAKKYGAIAEDGALTLSDAPVGVDIVSTGEGLSINGKPCMFVLNNNISFDATGIGELKGENGTENSAVYDLSGRRVQKAQKGVFIQNGKVVVK